VSLVADYGRTSGACFASDTTLARQLGLSRGGINAILRAVDASTEDSQALIRSHPNTRTGTRTRRVRPPAANELAVCIPAGARDVLPANRFKVYCMLSLREHLDEVTPLGFVAASCSITVATARRCVAELTSAGWISRSDAPPGSAHRYRVHRQPQPGVATQLTLFPQEPHQAGCRSDHGMKQEVPSCGVQLELLPDAQPPVDPATAPPGNHTTQPPVDPIALTRSPEHDPVNRRPRGGCCSREAEPSVTRASRPANQTLTIPTPRRSRHEPALQAPLPADLAEALAPVADLWHRLHHAGARATVALAARRELAVIEGFTTTVPASTVLAERLLRRRHQQGDTPVADPGGWLHRRGLPARPGCGDRLCDEGTLISNRATCPRCAENLNDKRAARRSAFAEASAAAGAARPEEIRRLAEAHLRHRHKRDQQAELLRRKAAAGQRAAREALGGQRSGAEGALLELPCRRCGRDGSDGLCAECFDITARERAVAACVELVLASTTTPANRLHALAERVRRGVQEDISRVLQAAADVGATKRTLAALGRITAENLKAEYHLGAIAALSASPAAKAEGQQAQAACRRNNTQDPTPSATEEAAARAARESQDRAAQHLLNQRLQEARSTAAPRAPGGGSRQWSDGADSGAWTCAYRDCGRLRVGSVPQSGMCPPCARKAGAEESREVMASPRIRAQLVAGKRGG
jgi:hypothetical protein